MGIFKLMDTNIKKLIKKSCPKAPTKIREFCRRLRRMLQREKIKPEYQRSGGLRIYVG